MCGIRDRDVNFKVIGIKVLFKIITLDEIIKGDRKGRTNKKLKTYPIFFYIDLKKKKEREN